jgi:hypothetical protein
VTTNAVSSPPQTVPESESWSSWEELSNVIALTPEDDHEAQWSVIEVCLQCSGPAKRACVCSRCSAPVEAREVEG